MRRSVCVKSLMILIFIFGGGELLYAQYHSGVEKTLVVDTFSSCLSLQDGLPCGWYATQKNVNMFSLQEEDGNRFVKIKTAGGNTSLGVHFSFDADTYRYLSWRWRIHQLPQGAREDKRRYADSAAGVYVIFNGKYKLNRIIKYVWSSTLEPGMITESPFNRRTKIVVLRSGEASAGQWLTENVDVFGDYQRIFGTRPPPVEAIAIMSDSDNTESVVEADYDDFRISVEK